MTRPSNDPTPAPDHVEAALLAARQELANVAALPFLTDDPVKVVLQAQCTMIKGIEAAYCGLRNTIRQAFSAADSQRSDLADFVLKQRGALVSDFTKQHEAALARAKAEELTHQARIKAGLVDAAKDALGDLLQRDRKHTRLRACVYAGLPATLLLLTGISLGWCVRGSKNVMEVTDSVSSLAALANVTRQDADAMKELSDLMVRGMTPTDIAALVSLHEVVLTTVGKVPNETVPAPCIAAVPDRTLVVSGKPIKACVVALKDTADVQGGAFLASAMPARPPR